jgi:hypothetical protein
LLGLRDSLRKIEYSARGTTNPYSRRILLIEAAVWSIVGYALTTYLEVRLHTADNHLDSYRLSGPVFSLLA